VISAARALGCISWGRAMPCQVAHALLRADAHVDTRVVHKPLLNPDREGGDTKKRASASLRAGHRNCAFKSKLSSAACSGVTGAFAASSFLARI
jgi:hypothetical protein